MGRTIRQADAGETRLSADLLGDRPGVWPSLACLVSRSHVRLALWILLAALTCAMFGVPLHLSWDYGSIQSVHVFHSVAAFGAMFYPWLAVWLVLLASVPTESPRNRAETLALGLVFGVGFVGFWLLHFYRGTVQDAYDVMSLADSIQAGGTVSSDSPGYSTFPGSGVLVSTLTQVTGASTPHIVLVMAVLQLALFTTLFHLLLVEHLGRASMAAWMTPCAVALAMYSSVPFFNLFFLFDGGTNGSLILFPLCLLLVLKYVLSGRQPRWGVLLIVALTALTITHFVTSVVLLLWLSIFALWLSGVGRRTVSWSLVALGWVIVAAWEVVTPFGIWDSLVTGGREAIEEFIRGAVLERWFLPTQTSSYLQERIPLWASSMFYLWLAILLGLTLAGVLSRLLKVRHLDHLSKWGLSGLIALVGLSILLLFLGDIEESANRTLWYAPFVCIPLVFLFVSSLGPVRRTAMITALAALLVILSLPTSLAFNRSVAQFTTHAEERAGGEFLQHALSEHDSVQLYGPQVERYIGYYLPQATDLRIYSGDLRTRSQAHLWQQMHEIVTEFLQSGTNAHVSVVAWSPRWREPFLRFFGEDPVDDWDWQELQLRVAQSSRFYDNGPIEYFGVWGNP
jgi:hypothetical protein